MKHHYGFSPQKGTMGTVYPLSSPTHMRTRETSGCADDELDGVPDGEVVCEGSEPLTPLPQFDCGNCRWPDMLQRIVDHGNTPAQRDILLLGAIDVIGATLGPKVRTLYDGKWLSPCLMLFVVAPPASGKGALAWLRMIAKPFHDELTARYEREKREYRARKMRFDALGKARAQARDEDIPEPPVRRFFLIPGNNSGTGMQANLINSGGRGIIFETEADTLSAALKTDYGHFDDALRNAFDHERICYYRRTDDESREVERSYLSVLLSGTPGQVQPLVGSAENGLASRITWYYMPPVKRWESQFGRREDVGAWFERLGREWKRKVDGMKEVAFFTFQLTEEQQEYMNLYMSILFGRGMQSMGNEVLSTVIRIAPQLLRIMSVVAFLRCLETGEGFEPDPGIPAENVSDGICPRRVYGISQDDFSLCLWMSDVLLRHAMHALSLLPAVEVCNRGSADRDALYRTLSPSFTRKEYVAKAEELGIPQNTALQWLKRSVRRGQVLKVDRGMYEFAETPDD